MFAMGSVTAIMVGQQLGAGDIEGAKNIDSKLIFITEAVHIAIGLLLILTADLVPMLYEVDGATRDMAAAMLRIQGLVLPVHSYVHVAYFTIRSGGKTVITFLFDCFFTWCVPVVVSYVVCRLTGLDIIACYAIVQATDLIKMAIAMPMLKSGFWAKNIIR